MSGPMTHKIEVTEFERVAARIALQGVIERERKRWRGQRMPEHVSTHIRDLESIYRKLEG